MTRTGVALGPMSTWRLVAAWTQKEPMMNDARLTEAEQQSLGRVLMLDHGCIHHQGPVPFLNPCRACMRRVDLIDDWLAARAAAPVEAGLAEALVAIEAADVDPGNLLSATDRYYARFGLVVAADAVRALLRPAPAADGGAES